MSTKIECTHTKLVTLTLKSGWKVCAICGGEATQIHHLSYDPEIFIHLCVPCHVKVHQHRVGRAKSQKSITEEIEEGNQEKELWLPIYTTTKETDGI